MEYNSPYTIILVIWSQLLWYQSAECSSQGCKEFFNLYGDSFCGFSGIAARWSVGAEMGQHRPGELAGENSYECHACQGRYRKGDYFHQRKDENKKSVRNLILPVSLTHYLQNLKAEQEDRKKNLGDHNNQNFEGFVCGPYGETSYSELCDPDF